MDGQIPLQAGVYKPPDLGGAGYAANSWIHHCPLQGQQRLRIHSFSGSTWLRLRKKKNTLRSRTSARGLAGQYQDRQGARSCEPCAEGRTTLAGAKNVTECLCKERQTAAEGGRGGVGSQVKGP